MKTKLKILPFLFFLPFLLSLHNSEYSHAVDGSNATFLSPEGIRFISYSKNWDEERLKELHEELLLNTHGEEIYALKRILVYEGSPKKSPNGEVLGTYSSRKKEIILYKAEKYKTPIDYRYALSHEYGHHVQDYYFPEIDNGVESTWYYLRGLRSFPVSEGYASDLKNDRKWYLNEIFAEDYVLLFAPPFAFKGDTENNPEVYAKRHFHENQEIPNVFELYELHSYIEEITGFKVDKSRLIQRFEPLSIKEEEEEDYFVERKDIFLHFDVFHQDNIHFLRFVHLFEKNENGMFVETSTTLEMTELGEAGDPFKEDIFPDFTNRTLSDEAIFKLQYLSFDLHTNFTVYSKPFYVKLQNEKFQLINKDELPNLKIKN